MYKNINEFKNRIVNLKNFKELPKQYKNTKFIKLYYKIYEYTLEIPPKDIVIAIIRERNSHYMPYLFGYICKFIKAKDFYHWKERIYSLLTEKISNSSKRKYELLYRSKAKDFFQKHTNEIQSKSKVTSMKKYGVENPSQSKEIKEKKKATCMKKYGVEHSFQSKEVQEKSKATMLKRYKVEYSMQSKEVQEKSKATCMKNHGVEYSMQSKEVQEKYKNTCMKNYGVEHPAQSKEVQDKMKATCLERYGKEYYTQIEEFKEKTKATNLERYGEEYSMQSKEVQDKHKVTCMKNLGVEYPMQSKKVQEKSKATKLERYGKEYTGCFDITSHSKFGDEVCTMIDNLLGNPEDSIYYAKSGKEYCIKDNNRNYYIDMVIPSLGIAFEADGCYFHGLLEDQKDVKGTPVEEIHRRDQEKTIAIEKAGYKLFRIREDEWKSNKSKCLENLLKEIENYVHSQENRL